jgi:DNA-binding protein H-NS
MATYQEIVQKISELQKQAEEIKAREQAAVIADIREKIEQYGLTADDLGFGGKVVAGKKTVSRKVPVRYRDGAGNTWTGRGKRPGWLTQALASGKSMEDFLIR